MVSTAYSKAKEILTENRETLENITQALLRLETINGEELDQMLAGKTVERLEQENSIEEKIVDLKEEEEKLKEELKQKASQSVLDDYQG